MPLVWISLLGVLGSAPPAEAIRRAAAQVFTDERFQKSLPERAPDEPRPQDREWRDRGETTGDQDRPPTPGGRQWDGDARPRRAREPTRPSPAEDDPDLALPAGPFLYVLLWAGLALAAAWLLRAVWSRRRRGARPAPGAAAAPAPAAVLGAVGDEADALALSGRHAEALHALLARTLAHLSQATGRRLSPAWTAREIVRGLALPAPAHAALAALVAAVEVSHFGGRPVARADFERGRAHFVTLRDALAGAPR